MFIAYYGKSGSAYKDLFLNNNLQDPYTKETIDILRLIRSENVGPRTFWGLVEIFGTASLAIENIPEFLLCGGCIKPVKVFTHNEAMKELELLKKIILSLLPIILNII